MQTPKVLLSVCLLGRLVCNHTLKLKDDTGQCLYSCPLAGCPQNTAVKTKKMKVQGLGHLLCRHAHPEGYN